MSYEVIARKWRPQKFSDLVGQEHLTKTLKNAITKDRIANAYLFVGTRGIGKTTSARIFAKALNCENSNNGEPCCECDSCTSIVDGSNIDVKEIDAASNSTVADMRELANEVPYAPVKCRFKIYIIDEVHMLSTAAWNALLKTIEEPPPHVKFLFATTEAHKVLATILSRCQRFDLRRIPIAKIAERLNLIATTENVKIAESAINIIARAADGGMRDAQSLLDQIISFFGGDNEEISEEQALSLFGLASSLEMEELVKAVLHNNKSALVLNIYKLANQGKNLETLFDELLSYLRSIQIALLIKNPETILETDSDSIKRFQEIGSQTNNRIVQLLLETLSPVGYTLHNAINKQVYLENIILKAMRLAHAIQIDDIIAHLNNIRRNGELEVLENIPAIEQLPVTNNQLPVSSEQLAVQEVEVPKIEPVKIEEPKVVDNSNMLVEESPGFSNVVPIEANNTPKINEPIIAEPQAEYITEPIIEESNLRPQGAPEEILQSAEVAEIKPVIQPEPVAEVAEIQPVIQSEPVAEVAEIKPVIQSEPVAEEPVQPNYEIITDGRVSQLWHDLITDIKEHYDDTKRFLRKFMQEGIPESISNNIILVAFDEEYGNAAYKEIKKDIAFVNTRLKSVSDNDFMSLEIVSKKGISAHHEPKRKTTEEIEELRQRATDNQFVQTTLNIFGGMITDVHG